QKYDYKIGRLATSNLILLLPYIYLLIPISSDYLLRFLVTTIDIVESRILVNSLLSIYNKAIEEGSVSDILLISPLLRRLLYIPYNNSNLYKSSKTYRISVNRFSLYTY
ncbi:hypothetical protein N7537_010128, partial [Penicillium hordei]